MTARALTFSDAALHLTLAAVSAAYALALMVAGSPEPLLYLLPALLIFVPLLLGRRPGEDAFTRIVDRARRAKRRVRLPLLGTPAPSTKREGSRLTGGRLIAQSLAGRAPPQESN